MRAALFVGDASWDATFHMPRIPQPDEKVHVERFDEAPGGVVANAAVAASLAGVQARLLVRLGNDLAGDEMSARLRASHVAVDAVVVSGLTCRVLVLLEPHGEKRLLLYPGISMYPSDEQVAAVDLADVGWVHTAVYARPATAALVRRCRNLGLSWSVDLEPATFPAGVEALAACLDGAAVVFCNSRAAARLGADPVGRLRTLGVGAVVITRGPDGATWQRCADGANVSVAAPLGPIVDTTGAGDCLAGWFVAEILRGAEPASALRAAVFAATLSCGGVGAQRSFPTRRATDEVLAADPALRTHSLGSRPA